MAGENGGSDERAVTVRVVLRQENVIVLPEGFDAAALLSGDQQAAEALKSLTKGGSKTRGKVGTAWVEMGEFSGSKLGAIEAHAGKPGTADAIPGTYKAPSVSAMKGGVRYVAPPKPLIERELLS